MTESKLTSHYVSITVSVSVLWLLCYVTLTLQSIWNFLHKQQTRSITKNHNQYSIHCWNNTTYWFHAIFSLMKFLTHTIKSVICWKAWIMHINGRSNMNLTLQYVNFNKKLSYHQGTTQHNVCHNCKKNCEFSHDVLDHRRCNPQVQPSMSFDDHTNTPSTCRGKNFLSPEFGAKFKREVALFLKVLEFSYITE